MELLCGEAGAGEEVDGGMKHRERWIKVAEYVNLRLLEHLPYRTD